MKTFAIMLVGIISLVYFGRGQCSPKKDAAVVKHHQTSTTTINPTEKPQAPDGWRYVNSSQCFDWFEPVDNDRTTKWFPVARMKISFRCWEDSIWELEKPDGSIFLVYNKAKEKQKWTVGGKGFPETQISEEVFKSHFNLTSRIRFILPQGDGKKLDLKIGRVE